MLDVGTGTGAIALAIADERPDAAVTAIDVSAEALALAVVNAERTGLADRVHLLQADLADGLPAGPFDLVVSNPPYVEPDEIDTLQPEVRDWEPREALVGHGVTRLVAEQARDVLTPAGALVLEVADGTRASRLRAARGARLLRCARDAGSRWPRPGRRRQMDAVTAAVAALRAGRLSSCPRTPSTGSAPTRSRRRRAGWRSRLKGVERGSRQRSSQARSTRCSTSCPSSRGCPARAASRAAHACVREHRAALPWLGERDDRRPRAGVPRRGRGRARSRRGCDGDEREPPRRTGPAHAGRRPRGIARRLRRGRRRRRAPGRAVDGARPLRRGARVLREGAVPAAQVLARIAAVRSA